VPATLQKSDISLEASRFSSTPHTTHAQLNSTMETKNESPGPAALTIESAIMLRFPPFPAVPDGVELIPFHSFRPSGIRVPIDDDNDDEYDGRRVSEAIERDGLGIPTITLRVKHATDNLEKKKKRKKKGGVSTQQVQVAPERPKTWYELWEELEDIRRNAYDASVSASLSPITCCFSRL
jgi:hypothetical protein